MLRLLWKEFHEVKWYLLGLLTLPWVIILWGLYQKGIGPTDIYELCFWVCMLPLAFWAATRVQKDLLPNYMSVQWLPVNRWAGFVSKFVPGLLVAVLLPTWLRLVVSICAGVPETQSDYLLEAVGSSIYAFTFAASMFVPSLAAALIGVAADMVISGWTLTHMPHYIPGDVVVGGFASIALAACVGVWSRTLSSGLRPRAMSAAAGMLIGVLPALVICSLLTVRSAGSLEKFCAKRDAYQASIAVKHKQSTQPYPFPGLAVSPDGRYIAGVIIGPRGAHLEIIGVSGQRIQVPDRTALPAAWLTDGKLLFYTGTTGHDIHLNLFDPRTERSSELASFPPCTGDRYWTRPIISLAPDPSSDRVALLVAPPVGILPDLWVVDVRTVTRKLVRRSIRTGEDSDQIVWSNGSIVIGRSGEYCRFPLDGSRPVWVTSAEKEAPNG